MTKQPQILQVSLSNNLKSFPHLRVLRRRAEHLYASLGGTEGGGGRRGSCESKLSPSGRKKGGGKCGRTYLQLVLDHHQLPVDLHQLSPLLQSVGRRLRQAPAANCKQAEHQRLHILGLGDRLQRSFSRGNAECRALTFLYVSLRRTGKPLEQSWKAAETSAGD